MTASGNIDDKFRGNLTLGLGAHPGEATEVELEEAYIQTLPGTGLPEGLRVKAGRALWTSAISTSSTRTATISRTGRFLTGRFWTTRSTTTAWSCPSSCRRRSMAKSGGGLFRGDDRPLFGGSDNGLRARSVYARVGGDIGRNAAWRIGGYLLDGRSLNRSGGGHAHGHGHDDEHAHEDEDEHEDEHAHEDEDEHEDEHAHEDEDEHEDEHAHEDEHEHEDEHAHEDEHEHEHGEDFGEFFSAGAFSGDTRLYGIDVRFTMAPTGNARESEVILQAEYFWRQEDGTYTLAEEEEDGMEHHEELRTDSIANGWYIQGVYKPVPRWRIGARYARLSPPDDAGIDHDPLCLRDDGRLDQQRIRAYPAAVQPRSARRPREG